MCGGGVGGWGEGVWVGVCVSGGGGEVAIYILTLEECFSKSRSAASSNKVQSAATTRGL